MDQNELVAELLQSLINDVQAIGKRFDQRFDQFPTQSPLDYRAELDRLTQAVQQLGRLLKPAVAATDPGAAITRINALTAQLNRMEQQTRQRPEYKMSQYVQYGLYSFGLIVVLLTVATWFALTWKSERDDYAQAYTHNNWRVRFVQQEQPEYYNLMEARFRQGAAEIERWVESQEQADQKRAAAQKAAQEAKALTDQASKLENRQRPKGNKKNHL